MATLNELQEALAGFRQVKASTDLSKAFEDWETQYLASKDWDNPEAWDAMYDEFTELRAHEQAFAEVKHDSLSVDNELIDAIRASQDSQSARERGETPPNETQIRSLAPLPHYTDPRLSNAFHALSNDYPNMREVRGDGNCYYRSVMYGTIEQMILSPHRAMLFHALYAKFDALKTSLNQQYGVQYNQPIDGLLIKLREAEVGTRWTSLASLQDDLRHADSSSDSELVWGARLMTLDALSKDAELTPFLAEDDLVNIRTMGEDAQGAAVNGFILPRALGVNCYLERIQTADSAVSAAKGSRSTLVKLAENPLLGAAELNVHLLLRPGHYDLLYTPDQVQAIKAEQVNEFKQQIQAIKRPEEDSLLNDLLNAIQYKPLEIDGSFKQLLTSIDNEVEGEYKMERVLRAIESLNTLKGISEAMGGYHSSFFQKIDSQLGVLNNTLESYLVNNQPR